MPAYMVIEIRKVTDKEKYGEYVRKVPQTVARFGGKYLAHGGWIESITGSWRPERLIIIEFESLDKFHAWWNSSEYRALAPLREQSAETDAIVVEGVGKDGI